MTNKHLTDTEIQEFVLYRNECRADALAHMEHCPDCKTKAAQYRVLFEEINKQPNPVFDFDLATLVIDQLPAPKRKSTGEKLMLYAVVCTCLLLAGFISYYFREIFASLFIGDNTMIYALIITTVTGVLTFLCIDMYKKYKAQMNALNCL